MNRLSYIFLSFLTLLPFHSLVSQKTQPAREYQVKAVFLYNFAQFVKWPEDSFPDERSPLIIGILGDDPFGSFIDKTTLGDSINGHPLKIQRYQSLDEIRDCHILYVHSTDETMISQCLDKLKGRPILTVGQVENFAGMGGMIRFATENNRIRLHINLDAAREANLDISSKLLRLSTIVKGGGNEG